MTPSASQRDPTRRFSDRADYYVRSRPKYPSALLEFCRAELGLRPQHIVADMGSGTGFLSEMFVRNGNEVFGVEPNAPMRAAAESLLGNSAGFHSIDATAEATGLDDSSIDFITAGQAFHWFDPKPTRAEFQRILRPGGWVMLVWNDRKLDGDAFAIAYEQIVREFQTDLNRVTHKSLTATGADAMGAFFAPGLYKTASFPNPQFLDRDGLIARALSSSYLPLPGQSGCERMLLRLDEAFAAHSQGGKVWQDYETKVFYGRLG